MLDHTSTGSLLLSEMESPPRLGAEMPKTREEVIAHFASEHLEIAARERTFDGAYMRSALNAITTGIFVYRIFYHDFAPIAIVYILFGVLLFVSSAVRRYTQDTWIWKFVELENRDEEEIVFLQPTSTSTFPLTHLPGASGGASSDGFRREADRGKDAAIAYKRADIDKPGGDVHRRPSILQASITEQDGMAVVVPASYASQLQLSSEYFEWRSTLKNPPNAPFFQTSGAMVCVLMYNTRLSPYR